MEIGTDIISINDFPDYTNKKESRFFIDNFTENEINYALLNSNSKLEFARLFSIKESLVKANNSLLNINFNLIEIVSDDNLISFSECKISSSADGKYCISTVTCL